MTLALVTPDTPVLPSPSVDESSPTQPEKKVIAEYVKQFKERGFCKIDDASSNSTRLYNRLNQRLLPLSFVENDFRDWLYRNHKQCEYISASYLIRTLRHVIGPIFVPEDKPYITEQDTGCTFTNSYRKYKPQTTSTDLSPLFLEYLERLVPIPEERHIFVQWLAHLFQHPEERPSWHIMAPSDTGTGKGFLVEKVLCPLLTHTQILNTFAKLTSQFSTTLEEALFVLLDDAKAGSENQQTQLKSLLTEEQAYVERKKLQGGMVRTYTRFFLASNEDTPLNLEANERRWYVLSKIEHRVDGDETAAFIKTLDDWLDLPGSLDAVYHYFMNYSLEGFNHKRVSQSATLLDMVKRSKGIHADVLEAFIVDHPVFTTAEWMAEYDEQSLTRPPTKQIPALLQSVGYENDARPVGEGNKPRRICYPIGMPLEKIRAVYPPPDF
jgi:hypothetical protein